MLQVASFSRPDFVKHFFVRVYSDSSPQPKCTFNNETGHFRVQAKSDYDSYDADGPMYALRFIPRFQSDQKSGYVRHSFLRDALSVPMLFMLAKMDFVPPGLCPPHHAA